MIHDLQWIEATSVGTRHGEPNQDAVWCSPDGRFCLVADGGTRPGQRSEIASATCVRAARDLYRPGAGDDLIERIARAVNSELLHRIASDEPVGSTTLAAVHVTGGNRVLAAIFGDGAVLQARDTNVVRIVRPLRKYDYYVATEAE